MNRKILNKEQLKAINHNTGPLLIIAGAGTGKTTVISERIKWLITKQKVPQDQILALTFTEKAAMEMQTRVDEALPYGFTQMWIMTFHSFCDRILKDNALHLGLNPGCQLLTETDSVALVQNHFFEFKLDYYRPLGNPFKFISAILQHIGRLQDEDVSPEDYFKWIEGVADPDEKSRYFELAGFYSDYEKLKIRENKSDFGNLISYSLKLFRTRPAILSAYQKKFHFLLVDEFQDTNYAQNQLVNLLAGPSRNLTVVADDDQAIYRWRGASVSNVIQFKKTYPDAKIVVLSKNYRSSQSILDSSYKLIQNNNPDRLEVKEKINKKLSSMRHQTGKNPEFHHFENLDQESDFVGATIESLKTDYAYKDMAILVRANAHAEPFTRALSRRGIPYQFLGPGKLFHQPEIRDLIAYLRVLDNFEDNVSFYRVLAMDYFAFPPRDLAVFLNTARKSNQSLFVVAENASSVISPVGWEILSKLIDLIHKHFGMLPKNTAGQILYDFMDSSGLLKSILNYKLPIDEVVAQNIMKFFNRLKTFESTFPDASVSAAVKWIDLAAQLGESPQAAEVDWSQNDTVNILTVHSAKGLEFPVVFLVNLAVGRFPSVERSEQIPIPEALIKEILPEGDFHLQEERRLFYVGMTRAKDRLFLTAADYYGEGKRLKKTSPFVPEALGEAVIHPRPDLSRQLSLLDWKTSAPRPLLPHPIAVDYLSYSQIQTFIDCPLHYKAKYILKIPSPPSAASSFGNRIHQTLNEFYRLIKEGQKPDILEVFTRNWSPEGYESAAHAKLYFQRGEKYLQDYLKVSFNSAILPVRLEHPFYVPLNGLKIGGKIDRIDKNPDGKIEIIDYKTSTKFLSDKEADKDLQLSFYALAATILHEPPFPVLPQNLILSLYYFEEQKKVSTTRTAEQLLNAKEQIYEYQKQISQSDFKCSRSQICRHCDYSTLCDFV